MGGRRQSSITALFAMSLLTALWLAGCSGSGSAAPDAGASDTGPVGRIDAAGADVAPVGREDARVPDAQLLDASTADASDSGAGDASHPDASDPSPDSGTPSAAFRAIYDSIIVPKCSGVQCHVAGTYQNPYFGFPPRLLMPDAITALHNLVATRVDCQSSTIDQRIRVVPFNPMASAIMYANQDGLCTRRHNLVVPTVTADDMAAIEAWIRSGAM